MGIGMKALAFLTMFVGIFYLSGCGSAKEAPRPVQNVITLRQGDLSQLGRDNAMQHFITGATLDVKGLFAEAILEYQEALGGSQDAAVYFAISKDYALLGKFESALKNARESVRLDPDNIPYHENLAAIYLSTFQPASAIKEFEAVVRIDSENTNGWYNLARLYQQTDPQKALGIYEKLLAEDEDQWDILLQCATLYTTFGRYDDAAEMFRRMLEIDPGNRPLRKQLADTYARGGKFDEARQILESMMESDSTDVDVVSSLADVYLDQKQYQKSISLYNSLLAQSENNPEIKIRIAIGYFGLTEHDSTVVPKTVKLLNDVRKDMPKDWRPYWYLGAIAANQKNDSLAGTYFARVTSLEENNASAWWFLGTSLFQQAKYDSLLDVVGKAEKIFPNDARFYFLGGLTYTRLGRQDEALPALEQAYHINPKDVNTLSTLADTYNELHRYKDSDRLYEEALKIDSSSAIVLNNYGYSLAERGLDLQRALGMARQAVTAEPGNAAYLDTYGWVYYKLRQYDDAAVYIEKSIATGGASAVVHEHLGDVYWKLGRKDDAVRLWKKALELDPKNELLKKKIASGGA